MSTTATVKAVSVSVLKSTPNQPAPSITLDENGVSGDRHAGPGVRQVTLFDWDLMKVRMPSSPESDLPGSQNENIAVIGLSALNILPLDILSIGEVRLEVTILGDRFSHGATTVCADHDTKKHCDMEHFGIFTRVLQGGTIKPGDTLTHHRRTLRTTIVTVSDRVSRGKAEDISGQRADDLLGAWCADSMWDLESARIVVPDEADAIDALLLKAKHERPHVFLTTGGTGVSPRDITPEVIRPRLSKELPGIVEHIRTKYGADKPRVRLSRSVAGTLGETLVFALPGSPRAVEEYLHEITPLLDHLLLVVRGIDPH